MKLLSPNETPYLVQQHSMTLLKPVREVYLVVHVDNNSIKYVQDVNEF